MGKQRNFTHIAYDRVASVNVDRDSQFPDLSSTVERWNQHQKNDKPPWSSLRLVAAIEVVLCSGFPTQLFLVFVFSVLGLASFDADGELSLTWVVLLSTTDAVLLLLMILYFLRRGDEKPEIVFFGSREHSREFLLGIILIPLMVIIATVTVSLLYYAWPDIRNVPRNPFVSLIQSPMNAAVFAIVAIVAGGIREELQRAFILHRFKHHLGGAWIGLILFSIAFGLGHIVQGWDAVIVTALLGALWGGIYLLRGSVLSAIVSHAGFNLTEIILSLIGIGSSSV